MVRTPEKFAEKGIEVLVRHRVERIDAPRARTLSVPTLKTGEAFEDTYDRLVVATGARAVLPPIPGADLEGVFELRFLTDADEDKVDTYEGQSPGEGDRSSAGATSGWRSRRTCAGSGWRYP